MHDDILLLAALGAAAYLVFSANSKAAEAAANTATISGASAGGYPAMPSSYKSGGYGFDQLPGVTTGTGLIYV